MLIAFTLVALACAAAPAGIARSSGVPAPTVPPPLHIAITLARNVSKSLAKKMLDEADAVWRPSGITFAWDGPNADRSAATLEVVVDDDRGTAQEGTSGAMPPLGWIFFDDHNVPGRVLHVSYANAAALLEEAGEVVGNANSMPTAERETYLGRAMGRALAHELGHYMLASKSHTATGLMRATLNAAELFSPMRNRFEVSVALCETLLTRLGRSRMNAVSP